MFKSHKFYLPSNILLLIAISIIFSLFSSSAGAAETNSQLFKLKQGFNFVSFALQPSISPQSLINFNPAIEDIYLYSASAGSFLSVRDGSLTSLNTGRGYILKALYATNISVYGTAPVLVGNLILKPGFNLVGFSKISESINFSSLIKLSGSIKGIYKWSDGAGTFIQVLNNNGTAVMLDGIDPFLTSAQSYFFNVDSETTLNYDGPSVTVNGNSSATATTNDFAQLSNYELRAQNEFYEFLGSGKAGIKTEVDLFYTTFRNKCLTVYNFSTTHEFIKMLDSFYAQYLALKANNDEDLNGMESAITKTDNGLFLYTAPDSVKSSLPFKSSWTASDVLFQGVAYSDPFFPSLSKPTSVKSYAMIEDNNYYYFKIDTNGNFSGLMKNYSFRITLSFNDGAYSSINLKVNPFNADKVSSTISSMYSWTTPPYSTDNFQGIASYFNSDMNSYQIKIPKTILLPAGYSNSVSLASYISGKNFTMYVYTN